MTSKEIAPIDTSEVALRVAKTEANVLAGALVVEVFVAMGFGFLTSLPLIVYIVFGVAVVGTAYGVLRRALLVDTIQQTQRRVPVAWPPQELQCAICGSDAIDAIEYGGAGWRDFFGKRVHRDCKNWVWSDWRPR